MKRYCPLEDIGHLKTAISATKHPQENLVQAEIQNPEGGVRCGVQLSTQVRAGGVQIHDLDV
jgi:hypothetical protein